MNAEQVAQHKREQPPVRAGLDRRPFPGLGDALRAEREQHGLTQENVAEALGVGRTTITAAEKGDTTPSLHLFARLVRFYNLTPERALALLGDA